MSKRETSAKTRKGAGYFQSAQGENVKITAYQQGGQAVITEVRKVRLDAGHNELFLEGVPTTYQPNSLLVLDDELPIALDQVSYRAANLDKLSILEGSLERPVTVRENGASGRQHVIAGTLKAVLGTEVAVERQDNKRLMIVPAVNVELNEGIPPGLSRTPSLMVPALCENEGEHALPLLYEAAGFGWTVRYNAFVNQKAGVITRLDASVLIANSSGASFEDVVFKLLAGANYARARAYGMENARAAAAGGAMMKMQSLAPAAPQVASVGDLKVYFLPKPVSIRNGETKQVLLFRAKGIPFTRELFLPAADYDASEGEPVKQPVFVRLRLTNDATSKLGFAMPAGDVNILEPVNGQSDNEKTFNAGVDSVAEGEKFKIEFGPVSDVKVARRLVEAIDSTDEETPAADPGSIKRPLGGPGMPGDRAREIARQAAQKPADSDEEPATFREEEREVVVHNFKDEPVEVLVYEDLPNEPEWLKTPEQELVRESAGSAAFRVKVGAKDKVTLCYRLRWQTN
jgi:hypothetical protein